MKNVKTMAAELIARYPGAPDLAEVLDTEGSLKAEEAESTTWHLPDGSAVTISGPDIRHAGWIRPEYCAQPTTPSCRECSLKNYGRDCRNNLM